MTKKNAEDVWDQNTYRRIVLQKNRSAKNVVRKDIASERAGANLTKLNENVLRETYPLLPVEFTIGKLSKSKIFSKIDANRVVSHE